MAKLQISINDELLEKIDKCCSDNYMTRSGLISLACVQYVNQTEIVNALKGMENSLKKIANENIAPQEVVDDLKQLENTIKIFIGAE